MRIWDIAERRELAALAVGEEFCHVAFSPESHLFALTSATFLRLWDCLTGKIVAQQPTDEAIVSIDFSDDGERIIRFSSGFATIWDVEDLARLKVQSIPKSTRWLGDPFALSPDLTVAAISGSANRIVVVDIETGKQRWRSRSEGFSTVSVSPDGSLVVGGLGLTDGRIYVFDTATGRRLGVLSGHQAWISSLVFWPDGSKLASASADQTIRIWDMETLQPLRILRGHEREVWSLALSTDAERLISGSKDGSVLVWNAADRSGERNHWQLPGQHRDWCLSRDGSAILTVEWNALNVLELTGPRYMQAEILSAVGRDDPAFSNASSYRFSPSGCLLAVLASDGTLSVWDLNGRTQIHAWSTDMDNGAIEVFSQDESRIWLSRSSPSRSGSKELCEWDLESRRLVRTISEIGTPFQIAPGQWVFGRTGPNVGLFHDLQTGERFYPVMFKGRMASLFGLPSASPDGRFLVISHDAGLLTVWDTRDLRGNTNVEPVRILGGILLSFASSGFSPDGARLFGCSHGSEAVKIWDTATYNELLTLAATVNNIRPPVFSPDGRDLVTYDMGASGSGDRGGIFVWRAASWDQIKRAIGPGTPVGGNNLRGMFAR